jgi:hypothetical protein
MERSDLHDNCAGTDGRAKVTEIRIQLVESTSPLVVLEFRLGLGNDGVDCIDVDKSTQLSHHVSTRRARSVIHREGVPAPASM